MAHNPTRPPLAEVTEKPMLPPPSAVPWPGTKGKVKLVCQGDIGIGADM